MSRPPSSRRPWVRRVIAAWIALIIGWVLLEGCLWQIDPLGIATYVHDINTIVTLPNAEGYTLAAGRHELRHWSYTIGADSGRVMPPAPEAACVIAFVGDSVTFGQSVNDNDTFAYRLAAVRPRIRFANRGKIAYNIANVVESIAAYPADGYVYLLTDNDDGTAWRLPASEYGVPRVTPAPRLASSYYLAALWASAEPPIRDPDFWTQLASLSAREDVIIAALGSPLGDEAAARHPSITRIDTYGREQFVSAIDHHPNPTGHQWIADRIESWVDGLAGRVCD